MGSSLSTGHAFEPTLDYVLYTLAIPHAVPALGAMLAALLFIVCWDCGIVCCGWQGSPYTLSTRSLVASLLVLLATGFALTAFLSQLTLLDTTLSHLSEALTDTLGYVNSITTVCDRIISQLDAANAQLAENDLDEYMVTSTLPQSVKSSISSVADVVDIVNQYFTTYLWAVRAWFYTCIGVVWASFVAICTRALLAQSQVYTPKCSGLVTAVSTFFYLFLGIAGILYLCVGLGVGDFCAQADLSGLGINENINAIRDYYVDCVGDDPFDVEINTLESLVNQTAVWMNLTTSEVYHELIDALNDAREIISCEGATGTLAREVNDYMCVDAERTLVLSVAGLIALSYVVFLGAVFRNCVFVGRDARKRGYTLLKQP